MINLVSDKSFPKNVSCTGRGIPQGYDSKISRPLASAFINTTRLKLKNY